MWQIPLSFCLSHLFSYLFLPVSLSFTLSLVSLSLVLSLYSLSTPLFLSTHFSFSLLTSLSTCLSLVILRGLCICGQVYPLTSFCFILMHGGLVQVTVMLLPIPTINSSLNLFTAPLFSFPQFSIFSFFSFLLVFSYPPFSPFLFDSIPLKGISWYGKHTLPKQVKQAWICHSCHHLRATGQNRLQAFSICPPILSNQWISQSYDATMRQWTTVALPFCGHFCGPTNSGLQSCRPQLKDVH